MASSLGEGTPLPAPALNVRHSFCAWPRQFPRTSSDTHRERYRKIGRMSRRISLNTGNDDGRSPPATLGDIRTLASLRGLDLSACGVSGAWVCDVLTSDVRHVLFRAVEKILLWRDPVKSGVVLGGATLAYLLLEWSHFSLLSIVANTLLIAVSVAFLWNNIASFTGR